ncbi:tRNA (guanine-N(7)-)-methyltransferase [Spirochaetia bacterium]|nr:tRNA (guanine-N(7)-)-methyltransferase [Spirochaetia bacterium]
MGDIERDGSGRSIKSYVLRAGRMSAAQRRSYDELFPRYGIAAAADVSGAHRVSPVYDSENGKSGRLLDYPSVFGNDNPVTAEIGFGMGIATAMIAENNPLKNYLGIEVHRPGIGRLLWEIGKRRLSNIRIIEHDAVEVMRMLIPDDSLAALHVFFPDPWPKKRHHKRRLITRPFTDLLAQKLAIGGYLYMVTDWADYAGWALRKLSDTPTLVNRYDDFAPPQEWRPRTKFEQKGLDKRHEVRELYFVRE